MPEKQSQSESSKPPTQKAQGPEGTEMSAAQMAALSVGSRSGGPYAPTLVNPITVYDIDMTVSSNVGINIGMKILCDTEVMRVAQAFLATRYAGGNVIPLLRGQSGTATRPHAAGSKLVIGDAMTDFAIQSAPGLEADLPGMTPWAPTVSLGTTDTVVPVPKTIGFTSVALPASGGPFTLALPGQDLNGAMLMITGTGTVNVASTPTPTNPGGLAGTAVTVAAGQVKLLVANGGNWMEPNA